MEIKFLALNHQNRNELYPELLNIILPYYENPERILEFNLNKCTHIYLCKNKKTNVVMSFFLIAINSVYFGSNNAIQAIYLGLSSSLQGKNIGSIISLYKQILVDKYKWYDKGRINLLWWTTINPVIFKIIYKIIPNCNPKSNGEYEKNALDILELLKENTPHLFQNESLAYSNHPFILKNFTDDKYTIEYYSILRDNIKFKNIEFFERFSINERIGDRLIMISLY